MENKYVMNRKTSSKELYLVSCGCEKCSPDQFYGPGIRRYYTIHFILEGQGHYFIHDNHYIVQPQQCFFIPPDTITLYKAESSDPWNYVWICFNGEIAADLMEHCHLTVDSPLQMLSSCRPFQDTILEMMKHSPLTPANECYIQSGLYRIMAMLEEQLNASYSAIEGNDNFYITQAIEYVKKSISLDCTVTDISNYLHISRTYLFGLFKKHLHISPQEFLISARIMNARELLTITELPIADIAVSSGYQNPFAFSRAFKRKTGMTPSEYREKYRYADHLLNC